jgi:glycosyltransferase involved in cell wall biosynthesis
MPVTEPLLSVCVPTFNRQFLLQRNVSFHLESFRRLGISFEIVIVDDCSTDDTARYIDSIRDIPEISAWRRVRNSGFLSNYAFAMQRARGRYAVFLGDDDLLIPEKVVEYVRRMEQNPEIGVVQAPWMLVDDRGGRNADMGPFYKVPGDTMFQKGDFHGLLDFILSNHVFPEFMIIRRNVLAKSISSSAPFIFWAFLYTTRALDKAGVLFLPEPFARTTAVSDDPRMQQGNKECMFQWDSYRGGLEYLASQTTKQSKPFQYQEQSLSERIIEFMLTRQAVAMRLHINARNWNEAYIMYHRMGAYRQGLLSQSAFSDICRLAGLTSAAQEAVDFTDAPVILDPAVTEDMLKLLAPDVRARTTRYLPSPGDTSPRAWLRLDPSFPETVRRGDGIFDLRDYMDQYI